MRQLIQWIGALCKDTRGQDMIEYALMAGLAVSTAGVIMPAAANGFQQVMSAVTNVIVVAGANGS